MHLAFDPSGRYLVVSNHIGASLAVVPVAADGRLEPISQLVEIEGPVGPHRVEQKQSKPHFNLFDPAGRFVIVPDKDTDRTHVFRFLSGKPEPAAVPFAVARDGSGPRHASFHPHAPFVYLVNELDSTVTAYRYDELSGNLDPGRCYQPCLIRSPATTVHPKVKWLVMDVFSSRRTAVWTVLLCSKMTIRRDDYVFLKSLHRKVERLVSSRSRALCLE